MDLKRISPFFTVSPQLSVPDVGVAASLGFQAIINNRPDDESDDQPASAELERAAIAQGLDYRHVPVRGGQISDADIEAFKTAMGEVTGPVLAFCRTGTRSTTLWALSEADHMSSASLIEAANEAGYDISSLKPRLTARLEARPARDGEAARAEARAFDIVVVGGGAGGIATAASLLNRRPDLKLAIVEPKDEHYYQPGWTLVGGGVFDRKQTRRPMADLMPSKAQWIRAAAASFEPDQRLVVLEDGSRLSYDVLVAAPGIKLDIDQIDGLRRSLGHNGVTSNYLFDLAPYTWDLVQATKRGTALFTQPPMPIKCAGAPQKAMYLSCDAWKRASVLGDIDVSFHNAGPVLFGVADYVPALMEYVKRYGIDLQFGSNLTAVDADSQTAVFTEMGEDGEARQVEKRFDMIHICPPQTAPDFVRNSPLANEAGWIEVSPETLQHARYGNVFAVGDASSAPNAKTAAAVRAQAPVVAENALSVLDGKAPRAIYNGYGSCPLTVERGKIVLAEFGYGGKLLPTFPTWLVDGVKPTRLAWFLKEKMLPGIYFDAMLRGKEWMLKIDRLDHDPTRHDAPDALLDKADADKAA